MLPTVEDIDDKKIMILLKSLPTLSTGCTPRVLLIGYIVRNYLRQWNTELEKARKDEIDVLLKDWRLKW